MTKTLKDLSPLRRWREEHGLTLEEAGDLTGYSTSMWSRAERGERSFAPLTRVQIARRLGARIRDIFPLEEEAS